MNNRTKIAALAAGGVVACLLAIVWFIGMPSRSAQPETSVSRLTVRSVAARWEQWPATIEGPGNIVPWEEMIVGAQVEGQPLIELRANVGDRVRRGQVLARFDTAMLRTEVGRLRAEVEQAVAEVAQANAERNRAVQLADSGGVSEQDVMQRVTAAQVAAARLSASRAQLAARELDAQRAEVIAPDEGTVSARSALAGMVGTAGLELFRIIRRDRLEWRGELTAIQLSRVTAGQKVLLSLPDGTRVRARIRHLAPAMSMQTRLATVYADIEPGEAAHAGTYVNGRILVGETAALVVPASSITVRDGYSLAFIVSDSDAPRVTQQAVEVGRRIGAEVEILRGLREGDRVVAQGAGFLEDGDRVRVVSGMDERGRLSGDFQ